jgi:putative transposase
MEGRGVGENDRQVSCAELARPAPFAARRTSPARQTAAARAGLSLARFDQDCRAKKPGQKRGQNGSPRVQPNTRSVADTTTGGNLAPAGKRITFTAGHGIGPLRLIGPRSSEPFPLAQIKRVRRGKRAAGDSVRGAVTAERTVPHESPGKPVGKPVGSAVGSAVGVTAFSTDCEGTPVAHPRSLRTAAQTVHRWQRRGARPPKRSKTRQKALKRLATGALTGHRPPQDCARTTARALIVSSAMMAFEMMAFEMMAFEMMAFEMMAFEDVAHLVQHPRRAQSLRAASGGRFLSGVRSDGSSAAIPSVAVSPRFTPHDGSGGGERGRTSLSPRTQSCPAGGLGFDRDGNAARNIRLAALPDLAARNRPAGQAETGAVSAARTASGQTASTAAFARARRKRAAGMKTLPPVKRESVKPRPLPALQESCRLLQRCRGHFACSIGDPIDFLAEGA